MHTLVRNRCAGRGNIERHIVFSLSDIFNNIGIQIVRCYLTSYFLYLIYTTLPTSYIDILFSISDISNTDVVNSIYISNYFLHPILNANHNAGVLFSISDISNTDIVNKYIYNYSNIFYMPMSYSQYVILVYLIPTL